MTRSAFLFFCYAYTGMGRVPSVLLGCGVCSLHDLAWVPQNYVLASQDISLIHCTNVGIKKQSTDTSSIDLRQ